MELEELHIFCDDMGSCTILLISPQLIIDLHDVSQFVSQIILKQEISITQSGYHCVLSTHVPGIQCNSLTLPWETM